MTTAASNNNWRMSFFYQTKTYWRFYFISIPKMKILKKKLTGQCEFSALSRRKFVLPWLQNSSWEEVVQFSFDLIETRIRSPQSPAYLTHWLRVVAGVVRVRQDEWVVALGHLHRVASVALHLLAGHSLFLK